MNAELNRRLAPAALVLLAGATVLGGATSCSRGCDTEVAVAPATVQGGGQPRSDLELSARLTAGGRPVSGVDIEFRIGWPPEDGIKIGTAKTGVDGVARLHLDDAVGPESRRGPETTRWQSYQAEVSLLQTAGAASERVCVRSGRAPYTYVP